MSSERAPEPADRPGLAGIPLGRPFGIPVVVAPSWVLVAAFLTVAIAPDVQNDMPNTATAVRYVLAAAVTLVLFASILVHELMHSVVAQALGLPVRRIRLFLLGGVSEGVAPTTAADEYLVAVAGPLSSLLLSGAGFAVGAHLRGHTMPRFVMVVAAGLNLGVAAFNLLPGLPLDGGRVLRAGLWRLFGDENRATRGAAWAGRGLAVLVALVPLALGQRTLSSGYLLWSVVVAAFLWATASRTLAQTRLAAVLPGLQARRLARRALGVTADTPVAEAVRRANAAGLRALFVVDGDGRPEGLVSEAAVVATPEQRRPWVSVSDLARRLEKGLVLPAELSGQGLVAAVQQTPASEYLVVDPSGAVCGVLVQADLVAAVQAAG